MLVLRQAQLRAQIATDCTTGAGRGKTPPRRKRGRHAHRRHPDQASPRRSGGGAHRHRSEFRARVHQSGHPAAIRRTGLTPRTGRGETGRSRDRVPRTRPTVTGSSSMPRFRSTRIRRRSTTSPSSICPPSSKRRRSFIGARWTTSCRPSRRWPAGSTRTVTAPPGTTGSSTSRSAMQRGRLGDRARGRSPLPSRGAPPACGLSAPRPDGVTLDGASSGRVEGSRDARGARGRAQPGVRRSRPAPAESGIAAADPERGDTPVTAAGTSIEKQLRVFSSCGKWVVNATPRRR